MCLCSSAFDWFKLIWLTWAHQSLEKIFRERENVPSGMFDYAFVFACLHFQSKPLIILEILLSSKPHEQQKYDWQFTMLTNVWHMISNNVAYWQV